MIQAVFGSSNYVVVKDAGWMYDYGDKISITGPRLIGLDARLEIHFVHDSLFSVKKLGDLSNGVLQCYIPNEAMEYSSFHAYVYNIDSDIGETIYDAHIFLRRRERPPDIVVPLEKQEILDDLIENLNILMEHVENTEEPEALSNIEIESLINSVY